MRPFNGKFFDNPEIKLTIADGLPLSRVIGSKDSG